MSTTTSLFEGTTFLQPSGFKISINRKRFKNLEFFAHGVAHPSVSAAPVEQGFRRSNVMFPGDKLDFGELNIMAILDENMNVYTEIFDWLEYLVEVNNHTPADRTLDSEDISFYDIVITVLSSSNTALRTITYKDAFPVSLGEINFTSQISAVEYVTFPINFRYSTFQISS